MNRNQMTLTYRNGINFNFHLSFKCSQHFIKLYINVLKNGIDKPVKKILIIKQIRLISNTRYVWRTVWRLNANIKVKKANDSISTAMHMDHET